MIVGGYTLDLYCDEPGCPNGRSSYSSDGMGRKPWTFFSETGADCRKAARRDGWTLRLQDSTAWCPNHKPNKGAAAFLEHYKL